MTYVYFTVFSLKLNKMNDIKNIIIKFITTPIYPIAIMDNQDK